MHTVCFTNRTHKCAFFLNGFIVRLRTFFQNCLCIFRAAFFGAEETVWSFFLIWLQAELLHWPLALYSDEFRRFSSLATYQFKGYPLHPVICAWSSGDLCAVLLPQNRLHPLCATPREKCNGWNWVSQWKAEVVVCFCWSERPSRLKLNWKLIVGWCRDLMDGPCVFWRFCFDRFQRRKTYCWDEHVFSSSSLCHFFFLFLDTSEMSIIEMARLALVQSAHLGRWRIRS